MNINKRIGIILIVLIFITILLIFLVPVLSNKYTYKSPSGEEFAFYKAQAGDVTMHVLTAYTTYRNEDRQSKNVIPLRNGPNSLEDIEIEKNINNKILNKKIIYITLDPNLKSEAVIASIEVAKVLGTAEYGVFKITTQGSFIYPSNNTNSTQISIITCENANKERGVIWLNIGKENKIYSIKECVVVEAIDYENLIKVADRLVYSLLNVM